LDNPNLYVDYSKAARRALAYSRAKHRRFCKHTHSVSTGIVTYTYPWKTEARVTYLMRRSVILRQCSARRFDSFKFIPNFVQTVVYLKETVVHLNQRNILSTIHSPV